MCQHRKIFKMQLEQVKSVLIFKLSLCTYVIMLCLKGCTTNLILLSFKAFVPPLMKFSKVYDYYHMHV